MDTVVYRTNRFLVTEPDRNWWRVLLKALAVAAVITVTLFLVGWPRLRATAIHYDLIRLRAEVHELTALKHQLEVELERLRDPVELTKRASELGLVPASPATTPARFLRGATLVAGGGESR